MIGHTFPASDGARDSFDRRLGVSDRRVAQVRRATDDIGRGTRRELDKSTCACAIPAQCACTEGGS